MISRQDHVAQDQVDGLSESLSSIPTVTASSTAPVNPKVGDIWVDGSSGNQMQRWDGTSWDVIQFGTQAIASESVTTALLAAGAVTAANVQAGTVVAGIVDGTTIEGAQVIAHGTQGDLLVYDGTPAAGNLILASSGTSGADAYGNAYEPGLTLPGFVKGAATQGGVYLPDNLPTTQSPAQLLVMNVGSLPELQLLGPFPKTGGSIASEVALTYSASGTTEAEVTADYVTILGGNLELDSSTGYVFSKFQTQFEVAQSSHPNQPLINATDPVLYLVPNASTYGKLQVGSGPSGAYYYEEVTLKSPAQSIATNTVTQVSGYADGELLSDYGSAWNLTTGVWTCPASGPYDWSVMMGFVGTVSGNRCVVRVCKTLSTPPFYCLNDTTITSGNLLCASGMFYAVAGDQYHVEVWQSSGGSRALDPANSYVHIGRRL